MPPALRDDLWGGHAASTSSALSGDGVAKQTCGTCRFFEEAGLAGSGWCHHPQRNVTTGAKILVRRNELACRDDWHHSLWESASGQDGIAPTEVARPVPIGPLEPVGQSTVRALLQVGDSEDNIGEDVLLSEARIIADPRENRAPQPKPSPAAPFDTRSAVFRAREAFRDRTRSKSTAARQSTGAIASDLPRSAEAARPITPEISPKSHVNDITPAKATPFGRAEPGTSFASTGDVFESSVVGPMQASGSQQGTGQTAQAVTPLNASSPPGASGKGEVPDRARTDDSPQGSRAPKVAAQIGEEGVREARVGRGALPAWFRTDLPKICRSCRDYRPGPDGQRGWCANSWAFTHRQLVQADQVAPCQSAIGDWWVPADDVWLVAADVSAHGRPTPLLDRIVASEIAKRRRS